MTPRDSEAPTLFVSAAEQSADEHAAGLIRAFRALWPGAEFVGLAGPQMRAAGCTGLADLTTRASMLTAVVGRAPAAARAVARVDRLLARRPFDAAVLVDSGTLHLPLARRCRARGVPVFYFIAPQTWASRAWRLRALRERVDRLAVILPFEEEYFRRAGVPATFVGHPLIDRLADAPADRAYVAARRAEGSPVVALLPGSRRQVVAEVLPGQIAVAAAVAARFRRARFLLAAANSAAEALARQIIARSAGAPPITIETAHRDDVLAAAEFALVASGTATLEAAYHRVPMIVMYNARGARWLYPLLRGRVIHAPMLSLPNLLAGRAVVPEFMPWYRNTTEIAVTAVELLSSPARLERMRQELGGLIAPLEAARALPAAARALADLLADAPPRRARSGPVGSRHAVW